MPDELTATGLEVKSLPTIVTEITEGMQEIYGTDINVDPNSPDGQLINIFAQAGADIREVIVEVNAGFDPDQAVGVVLDQRCAINNIRRAGGTYTIQDIEIVTSATVTLTGLDGEFNNINGTGYTVQDNAGNQFILIDTTVLTAGTNTLPFRSKVIGEVVPIVDTITNQVTVVLGVTSVNNPSAPTVIGQNQETDAQLRLRRQQSTAINSAGYLNGLLATILNLDGVSEAAVFENVTNVEDDDGIPAHGIWLIVEGGANTDIANVLYGKKSAGCDMKGDVVVIITTPSGAFFNAKFDRPSAEDLYIEFAIQPTTAEISFDLVGIKQWIVDNLTYGINEYSSTAEVTIAAQNAITETGGIGVPINVLISNDGISWTDFLTTTTKDNQWALDTTRIEVNIVT